MKDLIWLVDDELAVCDAYRPFLDGEYEVEIFNSGMDVLDRINSQGVIPSALITDVKMPGMDGISLSKEVRKHNFETPIVVLSGHAEKENLIAALDVKIDRFLEKPCHPEALLKAIQGAISNHVIERKYFRALELFNEKTIYLEKLVSSQMSRIAKYENLLYPEGDRKFESTKSKINFLAEITLENKLYKQVEVLSKEINKVWAFLPKPTAKK